MKLRFFVPMPLLCTAALFAGSLPSRAEIKAPSEVPQKETLRIFGAMTVLAPVDAAQAALREKNLELVLRAGGGSSFGLSMLAEKMGDVALLNRAVTSEDRAAAPGIVLTEIPLGRHIVVMAVSRDVRAAGLRAITREQLRQIYEGRITNWSELGGPSAAIKFFVMDPGPGQWEMVMQWLYTKINRAPEWKGFTVRSPQEGAARAAATPGSLAMIPLGLVDNETLYPLALAEGKGEPVEPTLPNAIAGRYPLSQPLEMVVADRPLGKLKTIIEFMTGAEGQALIKKFGYSTLEEIAAQGESAAGAKP